jgi:chromosomal replication initiation ATPase DnaA
MTEQFALNLPVRIDFSATSFVDGGANADARAALSRWSNWPRGVMALIGPEGAGKSHMGAIWANDTKAMTVQASDLEIALKDIPSGINLIIEDVDQAFPEQALFHVLNRAAERDVTALLLIARKLPVLWDATLPDLLSRLRALPYVEVHEPDDALLIQVLVKQLSDRGAPVQTGVIEYLLPRMDRSVAAARRLCEMLDKRALVKKSPVTKSVAREVLESFDG